MCTATFGGDVESMQVVLERGFPVDAQNDEGNTALHWAARFDLACVRFLLEHGASIDIVDKSGKNALMHAAIYYGSRDVLLLLLDHGIAQDRNEYTAIMLAATEGNVHFLPNVMPLLTSRRKDVVCCSCVQQAPEHRTW